MDRRSFLKLAAGTGLSLLSPVFSRPARAGRTRYEGPYFLLVHAEGGWDPTYLCDPKGAPINRLYPSSAIGATGPFRFAPLQYPGDQYTAPYSNEAFFTRHGSRLLAVNGIDVGTGNHTPAVRASWSGTLLEGYPTFGALAAFKSGVAVAANLVYGWFDTHNNHDRDHIPQLGRLLSGLDRILQEIAALGLSDKVIVVVGSDFGLGPTYYEGNGTDHWNLTSMLFLGPGIAGGRVVGGTDEAFKAKTFNLKTLKEEVSGSRITIGHIHRSLRVLAGIDGSEPARSYALPVEAIPIFTG